MSLEERIHLCERNIEQIFIIFNNVQDRFDTFESQYENDRESRWRERVKYEENMKLVLDILKSPLIEIKHE